MPYDDSHRALVQAFFSRHVLTVNELKPLIAAIMSVADMEQEFSASQITDGMVSEFIGDTNDQLSRFDFEIRSTRDQIDRSTIYVLVNTASDSIIQGATTHSADEIAFFRRLLDAMFETNNTINAEVFAVSTNDAIHLNKNPLKEPGEQPEDGTQVSSGGLTLKGAEEALGVFVKEGWLMRSKAEWYSLAPRGLIELSIYITQTYNDEDDEDDEENPVPKRAKVKTCHACRDLLTVGQRCEKLSCDIRMHNPCAKQFFRDHRKKCPGCQEPWTGNVPVGEAAAVKLRRRAGGRLVAPKRRAAQQQKTLSEDDNDEMADEEAEEGGDDDGDEEAEAAETVNGGEKEDVYADEDKDGEDE